MPEKQKKSLRKDRLKKAFPLGKLPPVLDSLSKEDRQLAIRFCPRLYVDPTIIEAERKYLQDNLESEEIAEALFLFGISNFPKDTTAAELRLLGPAIKGVPEQRKHTPAEAIVNQKIPKRVYLEYQSLKKKALEDYVQDLFSKLIPPNKPTCVVKYQVLTHPSDSSIKCIEYFTYWPIQLTPKHVFDYEPVYVFVQKGEPFLIVINANPASLRSSIGRSIWKTLIEKRLKKAGHLIRTLINWNTAVIDPSEFNPMANYLTKAYGGKYIYEPIYNKEQSKIDHVWFENEQELRLLVSTKWHAYDLPRKIDDQKHELIKVGKPQPLKAQDLQHIEWEVRFPFQVPFLYPTVGGKNPLFHFPVEIPTLYDLNLLNEWFTYGMDQYNSRQFVPAAARVNDYRDGLLVELIRKLLNKPPPDDLWNLIEKFENERKDIFEEIMEFKDRQQKFFRNRTPKVDTTVALFRAPKDSTWKHLQETTFWQQTEKALSIDPDNPALYFMRGQFLERWSADGYDPEFANEALENYNKSIELDPTNPEVFLRRGSLHALLYNPKKALQDYNIALELDPNNAMAYYLRGLLFERYFRAIKKALTDYDQAIVVDPSLGQAYKRRGHLRMKEGQLVEALADLDRAIELIELASDVSHPRVYAGLILDEETEAFYDGQAYYFRGQILMKLGRAGLHPDAFERARLDFEKAGGPHMKGVPMRDLQSQLKRRYKERVIPKEWWGLYGDRQRG